MRDLGVAFEERLQEVEEYLAFLQGIEAEARDGPPRLGKAGPVITTRQQRMLYAGVFVQLYNLVESTVTVCLEAVTEASLKSGAWAFGDLSSQIRREWVKVKAKTSVEMAHDTRLSAVLELCQHLASALPVLEPEFEIPTRKGSWNDVEIEKVTTRLGFELRVSNEAYSAIKRPFRNEHGPLTVLVDMRNGLSHGSISFVECGDGLEVGALRDLVNRTANYMREVVAAFVQFIEGYGYVMPDKRPVAGGG